MFEFVTLLHFIQNGETLSPTLSSVSGAEHGRFQFVDDNHLYFGVDGGSIYSPTV